VEKDLLTGNADLWKRFYSIPNTKSIFKWIKGHNNHANERCDELAVMASMQNNFLWMLYEKRRS
jgi:ribonuclease HI